MKRRSFLKAVRGIMLVLTCAFALAFALAGCAGKPEVVTPPPVVESKPADQLDAAIRETSDYLNKQLPAGNKLVILNIQSEYPALSEYVIDELIANTVNDRVFPVVDRQQLNTIRAELDFQYSGEVDDDTMQALGRMAGAQIIVSGAVSKIGDLYRLRVRALGVQTARIEGQFNRNIPQGPTIAALTRSPAPVIPAAQPGTAPAQDPSAAVAPPNGTYTFFPRLRAFSGAREVNVYLHRVVVRSGYVTMYLQDVPIETQRFGWDFIGVKLLGSWGRTNTVLKDLDNPSRVYYLAENSASVRDGFCTFQNVTGARFSLTTANGSNPPVVFDEIILSKPD
jgi:hypothetical protein